MPHDGPKAKDGQKDGWKKGEGIYRESGSTNYGISQLDIDIKWEHRIDQLITTRALATCAHIADDAQWIAGGNRSMRHAGTQLNWLSNHIPENSYQWHHILISAGIHYKKSHNRYMAWGRYKSSESPITWTSASKIQRKVHPREARRKNIMKNKKGE